MLSLNPNQLDPSRDILNYGGHDIIIAETELGPCAFHRPPNQINWFPFADVRPYKPDPRRGYLAQLEPHKDFQKNQTAFLQQLAELNLPKGRPVNKEAVNVFIGTRHSIQENNRFKYKGTYNHPTPGVSPAAQMLRIENYSGQLAVSLTPIPRLRPEDLPAPEPVVKPKQLAIGIAATITLATIFRFFAPPYHYQANEPDHLLLKDPAELAQKPVDPKSMEIFAVFLRDPKSKWDKKAERRDFTPTILTPELQIEPVDRGYFKANDFKVTKGHSTEVYPKQYISVVQLTDKNGDILPEAKDNTYYALSQMRFPDKPVDTYQRMARIAEYETTKRGKKRLPANSADKRASLITKTTQNHPARALKADRGNHASRRGGR